MATALACFMCIRGPVVEISSFDASLNRVYALLGANLLDEPFATAGDDRGDGVDGGVSGKEAGN